MGAVFMGIMQPRLQNLCTKLTKNAPICYPEAKMGYGPNRNPFPKAVFYSIGDFKTNFAKLSKFFVAFFG